MPNLTNAAGAMTAVVGGVTSAVTATDPGLAVGALVVAVGGLAVPFLPWFTKWIESKRQGEKIEEQARQIAKLQADLDTSREHRHRDANEQNEKILELTRRMIAAEMLAVATAQGVNTNADTIRKVADVSGLADYPVAPPIPITVNSGSNSGD